MKLNRKVLVVDNREVQLKQHTKNRKKMMILLHFYIAKINCIRFSFDTDFLVTKMSSNTLDFNVETLTIYEIQ